MTLFSTVPRRRLVAFLVLVLFVIWWGVVAAGWPDGLDHAALAALRVPGQPHVTIVPHWLVHASRVATFFGGGHVRFPLACGVGLLLAVAGWRRAGAALAVAWAGESLLVEAFKAIAHRARPELVWRLERAFGYSFPSGHSTGAMVLYPLLGWFLGSRFGGPAAGRRWACAGVVVAVAIGLTRVILGVHWASDVIGGWLLGGGIALFAATAINPPAAAAPARAPAPDRAPPADRPASAPPAPGA